MRVRNSIRNQAEIVDRLETFVTGVIAARGANACGADPRCYPKAAGVGKQAGRGHDSPQAVSAFDLDDGPATTCLLFNPALSYSHTLALTFKVIHSWTCAFTSVSLLPSIYLFVLVLVIYHQPTVRLFL